MNLTWPTSSGDLDRDLEDEPALQKTKHISKKPTKLGVISNNQKDSYSIPSETEMKTAIQLVHKGTFTANKILLAFTMLQFF